MVYYITDYLALVLLLMVYSICRRYSRTAAKASHLFSQAVIFNMAFCVSNIVDGLYTNYGMNLPVWVGYFINTVYFVLAFVMIFYYSYYALDKITEYAGNVQMVRVFQFLQQIVLAICIFCIVTNLWTEIVFYYNADKQYTHGPLWIICYLEVAVMIAVLICATLLCKTRTANSWKSIVVFSAVFIFVTVGFRFFFSQMLLEGIAGTITALFLFQNYQTSSLEKDSLTKLGNLNAFIDRVDQLRKEQKEFQVIMVSARNFSVINSNYGYEQGNKLLSDIAVWLENYFPQGTGLFRYSPVSFAAILPQEDRQGCEDRTHQLMEAFPRSWKLNRRMVRFAPIFVDLSCAGDYSPMQVMEELNYARKTVKTSELDHMHFDEMLYNRLQRKKMIIRYLDLAIKKNLFEVWYQPILCTINNCFCSSEALIRLRDIDGSFISPDEFIPIAEETGQIEQISEIVLDKVCGFLSENQELPIKNISINLTISQLQQPGFREYVVEKCRKYGVPLSQLGFEITERMLVTEDGNVQKTLEEMHEAGHMLLLDDFGTGYSNFAGIMKYSLDKIKLDKTLLQRDTERDYAVLKMLIDLFHNNGQTVVVEGVETGIQAQFLKDNSADFLQGFFYSRPLNEDRYREFMYLHSTAESMHCEAESVKA